MTNKQLNKIKEEIKKALMSVYGLAMNPPTDKQEEFLDKAIQNIKGLKLKIVEDKNGGTVKQETTTNNVEQTKSS
jgi:hypothetical protein